MHKEMAKEMVFCFEITDKRNNIFSVILTGGLFKTCIPLQFLVTRQLCPLDISGILHKLIYL